jgi:hypothetical protein
MRTNDVTNMAPPKSTTRQRERSVRTGQFLFDRDLVRTALALTDPQVKTEAQAAALFRVYARGRPTLKQSLERTAVAELAKQGARRKESVRRGAPEETPRADTFDTFDWEDAQRWLLKWLPEISRADGLSPARDVTLCRAINIGLFTVAGFTIRLARRDGNRDLIAEANGDSVAGACVRAMLPFLLQPYGWPPHWLAQCELRDCGKWFLREGKTGTRELYCSKAHASVARIRRYRGKRA